MSWGQTSWGANVYGGKCLRGQMSGGKHLGANVWGANVWGANVMEPFQNMFFYLPSKTWQYLDPEIYPTVNTRCLFVDFI